MSTVTSPSPGLTVENIAKSTALGVTILGGLAWIAGRAYLLGYWSIIGWKGPVILPSIHETAFYGFYGPTKIWFWAVLALVSIGSYIALMEFLQSRGPIKQLPRKVSAFEAWWRRGQRIDTASKRFFGSLIFGGLLTCFVLLVPLATWIIAADYYGRSSAINDVCSTRRAAGFPTQAIINEKTVLPGRFLERTDKYSILLDRSNVYVVTVGDQPRVLDRTSVASIQCPVRPGA